MRLRAFYSTGGLIGWVKGPTGPQWRTPREHWSTWVGWQWCPEDQAQDLDKCAADRTLAASRLRASPHSRMEVVR